MTLTRVLRTAKATLSRTFYLDEAATDADGTVTVAVTRLDGTPVDAQTASGPVAHAYTYTFPGRDVVDDLVLTWGATIGGDAVILDQDRIEVVGGFYFTIAAGRASDSILNDLAKFPTERLIEKRIEVEDECERICGQAMVPRFKRLRASGSGGSSLYVGWPHLRALRAVSVYPNGGGSPEVWSPSQLATVGLSRTGLLTLYGGVWPVGTDNVLVEFEHGLDYPAPEISRVAKIRLKSMLLQPKSAQPDRAAQLPAGVTAAPATTPAFAANVEKTGLPDVDAAYARIPSPTPGFG